LNEDAIKVSIVELVDKSEVPKRRFKYDWGSHFTKLELSPEKVLRFKGVPRSTVRQAVKRYNATHKIKLVVSSSGNEVYVQFKDVPVEISRDRLPTF
jgi:hypothetical protein